VAARSHYVHGSDAREQARLALMNELLNEGVLRELRLRRGERVLDVGTGTAILARAIARGVQPGGSVVGVERDPRQIEEARGRAERDGEAGLVDLRQGEAFDLPLRAQEWGSFDLAHARFLLEHVGDPLAVVRGMVRAVRVGGRIVVSDDDHDLLRLWPEPAAVMRVWEAYWRSYGDSGNDALIGRKLPALLHAAGARPVRMTWVSFGGCAGEERFGRLVENLRGILEGAREAILRRASAEELERGLAELEAWSRREDASFGYAIALAEGRRVATT